ncbi:MAG: translation initiation factor IF-2 [Bacteroidota bacterium]
MTENRPKKLFKVASEYNVSTQSIVDALAGEGFEVPNKPNAKITPEMVQVLEGLYGADKERNREQDREREEYEQRRNQIRSQMNESVTIDSFLEPLDDEEESAPDEGLLEPLDEPEESIEPEETIDERSDEVEPEEETPESEVEEDTASEVESDEDVADDVEEVEDDTDPKEKEESVEEGVDEVEVDEEVDEEVDASAESDEDDDEIEDDEDEEVDDEDYEDYEDEDDSEESDEEESVEIDDEDEDDEIGSSSSRKRKKVIRGSAGRLKGTKVVGKVAFTPDDPFKSGKKRKRKKDQKKDEATGTTSKKKKKKAADESPSKGRKKRKGGKSRVDEEDVEKKMKETMQMMKSSDTVGSKRQRRRKQRREDRDDDQGPDGIDESLEVLEVTEFITVSDLAELLDVKANEIITTCMSIGMMVSINQRLDASTIELVAEEFGREVEFVDAEELIEEIEEDEDDPEDLEPRAPIITVMGHVDHGKTSLLDYIRKTKVAAGEAGGITQHVGAYAVKTDDGRKITFLDTPGHEAFTAMRSRGAQATDIVILVVAADDSVMPQTIEAINHSKAAGVPMVVAINKIDKEGANPDRIKQQLSEHGVIVEEYGGSAQSAEVSALKGEGIEELLEKVLIEAELMELTANPNRRASGVVLEARVDKGKGTIANVLVEKGTLRVGDPFVAGPVFGRVRAMENEHGKRIEEAGPSTPIQLMGFDDIPQAGDRLVVPKDEKSAKEIATQRQQLKREQNLRKTKHLTLDDISRRMALGELSELNIIIKADVDGSIEALSGALQKLSTEEVAVNIIHTGSGAITESDVLLASASDGIIIGFQVRPTVNARKLAETEDIDIRLFSVIYDAVDEVRDALEGMLSPEVSEKMTGVAEVREIFRVSKIGTIAGCYVTNGKMFRNLPVRVIRDGVVIYDGEIDSLKRFKDDVKEVQSGYECGISIVGYNDLKVGDEIECYEIVESKRKLEDSL